MRNPLKDHVTPFLIIIIALAYFMKIHNNLL